MSHINNYIYLRITSSAIPKSCDFNKRNEKLNAPRENMPEITSSIRNCRFSLTRVLIFVSIDAFYFLYCRRRGFTYKNFLNIENEYDYCDRARNKRKKKYPLYVQYLKDC